MSRGISGEISARIRNGTLSNYLVLPVNMEGYTITSLYHSPEDTAEAENFFREAFTDRKVPDQAEILEAVLESGTLFDCVRPLVNAGIVESGAQFRRLIAQGGVQKNGVRVNQLEEPVQSGDVLKVGKRRFVQVKMC